MSVGESQSTNWHDIIGTYVPVGQGEFSASEKGV